MSDVNPALEPTTNPELVRLQADLERADESNRLVAAQLEKARQEVFELRARFARLEKAYADLQGHLQYLKEARPEPVFEVGTTVQVCRPGLLGTVEEVRFRTDGPSYKVAWWTRGRRYTAFLRPNEVVLADEEYLTHPLEKTNG